jgi:hypothetical protein
MEAEKLMVEPACRYGHGALQRYDDAVLCLPEQPPWSIAMPRHSAKVHPVPEVEPARVVVVLWWCPVCSYMELHHD